MWKRLCVLFMFFGIVFSLMYMRIYSIASDSSITEAAAGQGSCTVNVGSTYGGIYDRKLLPLVNRYATNYAVINPASDDVTAVLKYVSDPKSFYGKLSEGKPFCTEVSGRVENITEVPVFAVPKRYSQEPFLEHIIGYTSQGEGVCGIEKAYGEYLRGITASTKVNIAVDGLGNALCNTEKKIIMEGDSRSGIVLTIDRQIQEIAQEASKNLEKGAVIVMSPTGELRAVVSTPHFDPNNVAKSIDSEDSPFMNRAFSAYNVGSIFKLCTAATAIENGISVNKKYECVGDIEIKGKVFGCHKKDGHGILDMDGAICESCNTYFINLSKRIEPKAFIDTAKRFGFGCETVLADGIRSVSGNLQTESELEIPAEMANLSFGQGKLLATPVQVASMTAAIANGGTLYSPSLVYGKYESGILYSFDKSDFSKAIKESTAEKLGEMMKNSGQNESSNAKSDIVSIAGKTSTAQTGRYNADGTEILNAWFTGYFPAENPKYIVTVMAENGGYGNSTAAPVFKEIAEKITECYGG